MSLIEPLLLSPLTLDTRDLKKKVITKSFTFPPILYRRLDMSPSKEKQKRRRRKSCSYSRKFRGLLGTFQNFTIQEASTTMGVQQLPQSKAKLSRKKSSRSRTKSIQERKASRSKLSRSSSDLSDHKSDSHDEIVDCVLQQQHKQMGKLRHLDTPIFHVPLPSPKRRLLTPSSNRHSPSFILADPNSDLIPRSPRIQLRSLKPKLSLTPDTSIPSITPLPSPSCPSPSCPSPYSKFRPPNVSMGSTPSPTWSTSSSSSTPRSSTPSSTEFPSTPTSTTLTPRSLQVTSSPSSTLLTPRSLQVSEENRFPNTVPNEGSINPRSSLKDRYLKMFRPTSSACNSVASSSSSSSSSSSFKMKRLSPKKRRKGRLRKLSPLKDRKSCSPPRILSPPSPHTLLRIGNVMSRLRKHDPLIFIDNDTPMKQSENIRSNFLRYNENTDEIDITCIREIVLPSFPQFSISSSTSSAMES